MSNKPKKDPGTAKGRALTPKQQAFIREYLVDRNGTRAAIRAGYTENTEAAASQAYDNLRNPQIRSAINRQLQAYYERLDITPERILHELMLIATVDLAEAYDEHGALKPMHDIPENIRRAIAGVEVFEEFEMENGRKVKIGETTKLKLIDKKGALELLAKNLKLLTEKVEHSADSSLASLLAGSWKEEE